MLKKIDKMVVLFAFLLLYFTVMPNDSIASASTGLFNSAYVKEARVTVNFPESVYVITRDSLPTDDFFQAFGTEFYEST